MRLGDFVFAVIVALFLLFLLSRTQAGANLFFSLKGSAPSS